MNLRTLRPLTAVLAAAGVTAAAALAGANPASASPQAAAYSTRESCTIYARAGQVRVTADWVKNGLTKTGFIWIETLGSTPFRIRMDRADRQRGVGGYAAPGAPRSWTVRYPVAFYTHASVRVQGPDGTVAACVTR